MPGTRDVHEEDDRRPGTGTTKANAGTGGFVVAIVSFVSVFAAGATSIPRPGLYRGLDSPFTRSAVAR
jgi:hypothetical protein